MKLTLRQLQVFAEIAKTENVSRAAERLAMSQSAASSALVELERLFSCPLFDRIGKSLHLNSVGKGLLPRVETLLDQAADIERYLAGGQLGPLRVAATLTIGNYLATLIVADYLRQHPEAEVGLHVANTEAVADSLLRFEHDLGLVEGEISHPDLAVEPWLVDELVVFCAPGHVLDDGQPADTASLARQAWILREKGSGTRTQFDRSIGRALDNPRPRLELEHTEAIKRAVESGLGIGCLSRLALREALRRGSLREVATPQFDLRRNFYFVSHRQRPASAAVTAFRAACAQIVGPAADTGELQLPFIL